MSLATSDAVRRLQQKLYDKAKAEPTFRFYALYDKVYRSDILAHAWKISHANAGAPGVDGVRFEDIETQGAAEWLETLGKELREKTYKPAPVRRALIPKPGGGERPLGIPTVRDRVVQTAVKLVLEPIFEADFEDMAYGYRPGRSAQEAVKEVHGALCDGYTDVVDANLSKFFDSIPHAALLKSVARRVADREVLRLIKAWLKAPVEERDGRGNRRMSGGKKSTRGTPQGGAISPLLANVYMHRYLRAWKQQGKAHEYRAKLVNYADDFVILSRGKAAEALAWTRRVMTAIGLELNEVKTCVRKARRESFDFLGYTFGPDYFRKDGHWYLSAKPGKKAVQRLKGATTALLRPGNLAAWPDVVGRLNRVLRGWANYFSYGTRLMAYRAIDNHVYERVRHFLRRRHKVPTHGTRRFPRELVFGELGVLRLRTLHLAPTP